MRRNRKKDGVNGVVTPYINQPRNNEIGLINQNVIPATPTEYKNLYTETPDVSIDIKKYTSTKILTDDKIEEKLSGYFDILKLKMDINYNNGEALHFVIKKYTQKEYLYYFINHGADINIVGDSGFSPLQQSVISMNYDFCKILIDAGANLDYVTVYFNLTALNIALDYKKFNKNTHLEPEHIHILYHQIAILLIDNDPNLNILNSGNQSSLMVAIQNEQYDIAILLINKGVDLDVQDVNKNTALLFAMDRDIVDEKIVTLLIQKGCDLNLQDKNGHSALFYSIFKRENKIFKMLLENKADPNLLDNKVSSAFLFSIENNFIDKDMFYTFTKYGTDVDLQNKDGNTGLHILIDKKKTSLAERLINFGANLNIQNLKGETALHLAIDLGNDKIIFKLIYFRANLELKDKNGFDALYKAFNKKNSKVIEELINKDVNVNNCDIEDENILLQAILHEDIKIVKLLIDKGFDINRTNFRGVTVLNTCINFYKTLPNSEKIINLLIDSGADLTLEDENGLNSLHYSASVDNYKATKRIIESGIDLNVQTNDGSTALCLSIKMLNNNISILLIEKGANLNLLDKLSKSVLIHSILNGNTYMSQLMIEHGADVNLQDENGYSALFYSVNGYHDYISTLLIENGANLNLLDKLSKSVLMHSILNGNFDMTKLLIEKGANINLQDNDGDTAMHIAVYKYDIRSAYLLYTNNALSLDNNTGQPPLYYALLYGSIIAALLSSGPISYEIIKMLLNKKYEDGNTGLMLLIQYKPDIAFKKVLTNMSNLKEQNNDGYTALHIAVLMENNDLIELLINNMSIDEIQIQDEQGNTALHLAILQNSNDIVFQLLLKKYNQRYFMLKNIDGDTVLELKYSKTGNINKILTSICDKLNIVSIKKNLNSYIKYFNDKIKEEKKLAKSLEIKTKSTPKPTIIKKYSGISTDFKNDVTVDEDYYDKYKDDYEENKPKVVDFRTVTTEKTKVKYMRENYDITGKIAIHVYNGFFNKMLGVHGLWSNSEKKYLDTNYTTGDEFKICKNFSKENGEMNDNLMRHEWEKHGIFSGYMKYRDYFEKSCELSNYITDMIKKIPAWNDERIKDEKIRWSKVKDYVRLKYKDKVYIKESINDKILMNHELYFPIIKKANEDHWKLDIIL